MPGTIIQDPSNGAIAEVDRISHKLITIDQSHHEIHEGQMFRVSQYTASVNLNATISFYMLTPAAVGFHMFHEWMSGGAASFRVYEGPTITANSGTNGVAIYNCNRSSTTASLAKDNATVPAADKVATGVTKTGNGLILVTEYDGISKTLTGKSRSDNETILAVSTKYLFEVTALGDKIPLTLNLSWYEEVGI